MLAATKRFEVRRRLGAGATGIVYEAYDLERQRVVALKALRAPTPKTIGALKQEVHTLSGIFHPNLVGIHELHADGDTCFFTMELVEGIELARFVAGDEQRLRDCLRQIGSGIQALHDRGKLHRDVKPSNVLVTGEGRAVLLDYGVVAEIGAHDPAAVGTPAYVAPEQAAGQATAASDWYSFGVLMFELLAGTRPFLGSSRAILHDKVSYPARPVRSCAPAAPADLAELCDELLRREPERRPSGQAVLARLGAGYDAPRAEHEPVFLGRSAALASLQAALHATASGGSTVAHVYGPSGIGKSTLLAEFARIARQHPDSVVLTSRCYPEDLVPYKAIDSLIDALASYLDTLPRAEADALLPRDIELLARVFPVLSGVAAVAAARRVAGAEPEPAELRRRAFVALHQLISRLAERRPLVILIDDLQWGDADGARILEQLVATADPPSFLLVLAYRSEHAHAPALRVLRGERARLYGPSSSVIELSLEPLPADESRRLVATLLDCAIDDPRCAAIAEQAGGIPFLIHQLSELSERAGSLGDAIEQRLEQLGDHARCVLELTVVAGGALDKSLLEAAGELSAEALDRAVSALAAARLLRHAPQPHAVECYHDRIRETVATRLDAERKRELHARLVVALSAGADVDHEALLVHCLAAGDRARAAEHALAAAETASRSLAFERAAELFRQALEVGSFDEATSRTIRIRLGDALSHAGCGAEAAAAFLAAAPGAPAAVALDLRRRAASQFLRTGRIDEGLAVLTSVFSAIGGKLPRSSRAAVMSLVVNRARLRLRGLASKDRDETEVSQFELTQLDTLGTAATDLAMVDTIVGATFATRALLAALAVGEPKRLARALTIEAMLLVAQGRRRERQAAQVLGRAREIIERLGDPELSAWLTAAHGLAAFTMGRFRSGAEASEEAVRKLREECTGVTWEVGGVDVQSLWSLFYLGRLRQLTERVEAAVEAAHARRNWFDAANFGTGRPALAWVVVDRVEAGRRAVDAAMATWSQRGFHLQHYYALLANVSFDLYDGDAAGAAARVAAAWPLFRRSRLQMCQSIAIESEHLRGRVGIAANARGLLDPAIAALGALEGIAWADAFRALLVAGRATDRGAAAASLALAGELCRRAELEAFASAAARRRGELLGDRDAVAAADRALRAEAVADPARFSRMLVPLQVDP